MALSMHETSLAVMARMLRNLAAMLAKAETQAAAKGLDPASLVEARLAPDMLPLKSQIYIATDGAKLCAARLAGLEAPSWPDTESTFPELQARIEKALAYLESVTPEQVNGSEERQITMKFGPEFSMDFTGQSFLLGFALPNFFFHITTAYALLRANGIELGKRDFLAGI